MKLASRVTVNVAIETCHALLWARRLAIVGQIEFFLRQGRQQQSHPFELHRRHDFLKKFTKVRHRHNLAARNVTKLRPLLQENRWRELRQECVGNVELDVKSP